MCTMICRVYRWKTETESTNWGGVYMYLYHELIVEAAFYFAIQFSTDKLLRDLFDLNFVSNGKGISLPK